MTAASERNTKKHITCIALLLCLTVLMIYTIGGYGWTHLPYGSNNTCPIQKLRSVAQFLQFLDRPKANCHQMLRVGGTFVNGNLLGGKYVCIDSPRWNRHHPCMVLSFGIQNEWSFEAVMGQYGCQVLAFDPFIQHKRLKRRLNVHPFSIGISNLTAVHQTKYGLMTTNTYSKIIHKLRMENATVDYLKMNANGAELEFLQNTLLETPQLLHNIEQMGIQIIVQIPTKTSGPPSTNMKTYYDYFQRLECIGFKIMSIRIMNRKKNVSSRPSTGPKKVYEIVWRRVSQMAAKKMNF